MQGKEAMMRVRQCSRKHSRFGRAMVGLALLFLITCFLIFLRRIQTFSRPQARRAEQRQGKGCDRKPLRFTRTMTGFALLLLVICARSEEHTSELQSRFDLVCRLL